MKLSLLLIGRKAMTNLDSILKSRDITLPTKVCLVKAMVFPGVLYGCESWTIKKSKCWKNWRFWTMVWRRLLRVPWTTRRSNQSICKEISPEYSLEGLMLKLKLQYFGHLMWRTDSLGKTLMLGKTEGRRRRRWQDEMVGWHHQLDGPEFEQAPRVWWWRGKPGVLQSMGLQRVRHNWVTELNWTVVCQAPLSTEVCRQEYWSGLPFPFPGYLPKPGVKSTSPALIPYHWTTWEAHANRTNS